jgi:6-phosphogluconolactonase
MRVLLTTSVISLLLACGGRNQGPTSYAVGGTVSGLVGSGLILRNSNGETLAIASNGPFRFATALAAGATYDVAVASQPNTDPKQFCSVDNASGHSSVEAANVTVSCVGPFVYLIHVVSGDNTVVLGYTMNVSSGAFTPIAGSPPATGLGPSQPVVGPSGRFLYTTNIGANNISAYLINADTGTLSEIPGSPFTTGTAPSGMLIGATGRFAYVPANGSGSIYAYTMDATTGALTALAGSPYATGAATGTNPAVAVLHPSGKFLYTLNYDSNYTSANISAFAIDATTGLLTPVPGSPFATGPLTRNLRLDPTGRFAYGVSFSQPVEVFEFTINSATGALSPVAGSPIPFGIDNSFVSSFVIDATGRFGYATLDDETGYLPFTIEQPGGALIPGSFVNANGLAPIAAVAFAPGGQIAYGFVSIQSSGTPDIEAYSVSDDGALNPIAGPFACGEYPGSIMFDPSGKFLVAMNQNGIGMCPFNPATGVLSEGSFSEIPIEFGAPTIVLQQ